MDNRVLKIVETRLMQGFNKNGYAITSPKELMAFSLEKIKKRETEMMCLVYLDSKGCVIDFDICRTDVFEKNFKFFLTSAILKNSCSAAMISNITDQDRAYELTNSFSNCMSMLGLRLIDHICCERSFSEAGMLPNTIRFRDQIDVEDGIASTWRPAVSLRTIDSHELEDGADAVEIACRQLVDSDREKIVVMNFDENDDPISYSVEGIGTLNTAYVAPNVMYKASLLSRASSIVFIHNHPSGDSSPSSEDMEVFKRLYDSAHLLGFEMKDSIIVGSITNERYSFKESGDMDRMIRETNRLANFRKGGR